MGLLPALIPLGLYVSPCSIKVYYLITYEMEDPRASEKKKLLWSQQNSKSLKEDIQYTLPRK